jgi:hypothetical protein
VCAAFQQLTQLPLQRQGQRKVLPLPPTLLLCKGVAFHRGGVGRGAEVGRGLGVGVTLGVAVGVGVGVGVQVSYSSAVARPCSLLSNPPATSTIPLSSKVAV